MIINKAVSLVISLIVCLLCGIFRKIFTRSRSGDAEARQVYNAAASLASAVVLLLWGGFGQVSFFTLALGAVFGLVTALQQVVMLKALEIGPFSYTTVIASLSMLIPALSGALWWNEQIRVPQIIGIALVVVCFLLSVEKEPDGARQKASFRWLLFCIILFFLTGAIGVMQKAHQSSPHLEESNAFLITAFAASLLYSAVMVAVPRLRRARAEIPTHPAPAEEAKPAKKPSLRRLVPALPLMLAAGACAAVNNKLNLILAGKIDSAVFFPLVNGGGLILSTVSAFLLFRERISRRQWIGLLVGIAAVLLLCIG